MIFSPGADSGRCPREAEPEAATPLGFCAFRQADSGGGNSLGPLGIRRVAETLTGFAMAESDGDWRAAGVLAPEPETA